jgi:hypothetical protein
VPVRGVKIMDACPQAEPGRCESEALPPPSPSCGREPLDMGFRVEPGNQFKVLTTNQFLLSSPEAGKE